jgi:glycosyltransferase involved in cell wall biosynthesis
MVAAEAASAGVVPVVADHSGLAEVGAGIAAEFPPDRAHLVTFPNGDVGALRERLQELLGLSPAERRALGLAARGAVEAKWSWRTVGERLID